MRFRRLRALVDQRQTNLGHHTTDAMAPNAPAVAAQMPRHLSRAVPPRLKELFVGETSHQPQRVKHFKLSAGPQFVGKLRDVVSLYIDPPAHAVVLSVDER
jgi:hypothetical protein